jgi:hypothetical protein
MPYLRLGLRTVFQGFPCSWLGLEAEALQQDELPPQYSPSVFLQASIGGSGILHPLDSRPLQLSITMPKPLFNLYLRSVQVSLRKIAM